MSSTGKTRVPRSMELHRRALELIPGGSQLVSRRPSRYAKGVSPVFAVRAQGARFWDVDGFEYIDWVSGIGSIILGYCDPAVDEAVKEQISRGTIYSINHELELELAEELTRSIPCAEMVRYAKCGGEASAMAVRIARGVTGRDRILFCGYHGWHDWYLAANLQADSSLNQHLFPGIEPTGVPRSLAGTAIPFEYGKIEALQQLLDSHRNQVAAIIMEPLRSQSPPDGYLEAVKQLSRTHGAVFILDEVTSGFRLSSGGAQKHLGVTPDMAVFAKSISNGYPMAAVVGRREVMEPSARMFISSTYWSDTIGLRAALTTLQEIRRRDVPSLLHNTGVEIQNATNQIAEETGAPIRCRGIAVHPSLEFQTDDSVQRAKLSTLYIQEMAKRGCHGYPSFYLNAAQGPNEIEQTLNAVREVFTIIQQGCERRTLDSLLECDLTQDAFRRLVQ